MVIDVHAHLAFHRIYPDAFLLGLLHGQNSSANTELMLSVARRWLADEMGDRLVREMDEAGIASSVLLIIDGGVRFGDPSMSIEQIYEVHRCLLERHQGRFLVFAGVDPRRGRMGLDLFRRSVLEWGFSGMKLYPPMGFSLLDETLEPYLEICAERRLPVLTHSGPSLPALESEFARPVYVQELARRHPELRLVMAHGGYSIGTPEVRRAVEADNVMVDVSGFQAHSASVGWDRATRDLGWVFEPDFHERVLFGTDFPLFHFAVGLKHDLERICSVFESHGSGDRSRLENVLAGNAERLLSKVSTGQGTKS